MSYKIARLIFNEKQNSVFNTLNRKHTQKNGACTIVHCTYQNTIWNLVPILLVLVTIEKIRWVNYMARKNHLSVLKKKQ